MNRMKHFLLIILSFAVLTCGAKKKENPRSEIKVGYNYHEKFVRGSGGIIERDIPFVLLANNAESKFYCPSTEYKDSLESTPSGKAKSRQIFNEAVRRYTETNDRSAMDGVTYKTQLYVFKSKPRNLYTVYDYANLGNYCYEEPLDEIDWCITDSTKSILGYECILATADYHGRKWNAWFTPEIPVQDGPWKLCGLPGLILEAQETTGQHYFTAEGIEVSNSEINPIYDPKKYDKIKRLDFLRLKRDAEDHGNSQITARMGLDLGPDHIRNEEEKKIDYLETDYHR